MNKPDQRQAFFGWQCRVRQYSMRMHAGRPTPGMRPKLLIKEAGQSNRVIVLIHKKETKNVAVQFRHMAKKTQDPADRYDSAIKFLSATYFQKPESFRDELTAIYSIDSEFAHQQDRIGKCVLDFLQHGQRFIVPCRTHLIDEQNELYQASYWHNFLFNPSLPGQVSIVSYKPQWDTVQYQENVTAEEEPGSIFFK